MGARSEVGIGRPDGAVCQNENKGFGFVRMMLVTTLAAGAMYPVRSSAARGLQFSERADFVLLDVDVRDKSGEFVRNLDRSSFRVFDDGQERPIREFTTTDVPVTAGLVVDNSGSMASKRPEVISAGLAFVKQSNPHDQFFVVNFNDSVTRGLPPAVPFTNNVQMLQGALYFGRPGGQTALYDAVAYSLKHLELAARHRQALIVVSDGRDNVSDISWSDLLRRVEASRATIYTIGLYNPDANDLNPRVLRRMSRVSGGEFFEPRQISEIEPIFHQIAQDIKRRYTIGYVPDEVHDKNELRTIKVTAQEDSRKLKVSTRTKYMIAPFAASEGHGSGAH